MDMYIYFYDGPFFNNRPITNMQASDDDSGGRLQFSVEVFLSPDVMYYIVLTTYSANKLGSYTVIATGLAAVNIVPVVAGMHRLSFNVYR
jgi:hypothetical protein